MASGPYLHYLHLANWERLYNMFIWKTFQQNLYWTYIHIYIVVFDLHSQAVGEQISLHLQFCNANNMRCVGF